MSQILSRLPAALLLALSVSAWAQRVDGPGKPAPAASEPARPQVVALMAAVGDRITLVRQKRSVGSHLEPYDRKTISVGESTLNDAVLRGLDQAIAQQEPDAERVLLRWTAPEAVTKQLEQQYQVDRDRVLLDAVIEHLRPIPERQRWDRIEVILPKYFRSERAGMGSKLQGIGIYVQPLSRGFDAIDEGLSRGARGDNEGERVVNPRTGEVTEASTYVAPYMYFERVTLDARSLAVLARKNGFDATKYNDPMAAVNDVSQQMTPAMLSEKLLYLAERSAYQSVRGKGATVDVSAPREVTNPAAASAPSR